MYVHTGGVPEGDVGAEVGSGVGAEGEGGVGAEGEGGSGERSKKARIAGLYRPPTHDELRTLKETQNLFQSNLMRLQVWYCISLSLTHTRMHARTHTHTHTHTHTQYLCRTPDYLSLLPCYYLL